MPELVVIVGPIASGKTTVARALGARLREAGRPVAVLDLDDVVETIGGFAGLTEDRFAQAQLVFGRIVGSWLELGVDVIAHGPLLSPEEDEALRHAVPAGVVPRRVYLHTTYEVALDRVSGDPGRSLSRHPEILRSTYDRVEALRPTMPASEWTFDTTSTDGQTVVDQLAAALLARS